jgi:hypothetical protein
MRMKRLSQSIFQAMNVHSLLLNYSVLNGSKEPQLLEYSLK